MRVFFLIAIVAVGCGDPIGPRKSFIVNFQVQNNVDAALNAGAEFTWRDESDGDYCKGNSVEEAIPAHATATFTLSDLCYNVEGTGLSLSAVNDPTFGEHEITTSSGNATLTIICVDSGCTCSGSAPCTVDPQ